MSGGAIAGFEDLMARLDALIADAEGGAVDPAVVDYLRATRERVGLLRNRVGEGKRVSERHATEGEARLVVNGRALPVAITDRSYGGFGLVAGESVPGETYARLDIDGQFEQEIYEGLITYCRPDEGQYRIGLDVVSSLRIGQIAR